MQERHIGGDGVHKAARRQRLQHRKQQSRSQAQQQVTRQGSHQDITADGALLRQVADQALAAPGHQERPGNEQR